MTLATEVFTNFIEAAPWMSGAYHGGCVDKTGRTGEEYTDHIVRLRSTVHMLAVLCLVPTLGWAQDGAVIADDSELFSARFRIEFREMNDLFGEIGFEIEVIDGKQPTLGAISTKYGPHDRSDDVEVVLGYGATERPATLTFHYYNDVGFGVLPDDSEQFVVRVKRREG